MGNSGENNGDQEWYPSTASFNSLQEWKDTVTRIDMAIGNRIEALKGELPAASEKSVWEMLAPSVNVSWVGAHSELISAERQLHVLETDEKPLGSIGMALEGGRVRAAQDGYNNALAEFVLLDEDMRTKQEVRQTLDGLVGQVKKRLHLIEQMEKTSKELRDIHARLDDIQTIPDIALIQIADITSDETLIAQAKTLAKSSMSVLEKLPAPEKTEIVEPSLSSLFGALAKKSLASLRRSYTTAAEKPVKPSAP